MVVIFPFNMMETLKIHCSNCTVTQPLQPQTLTLGRHYPVLTMILDYHNNQEVCPRQNHEDRLLSCSVTDSLVTSPQGWGTVASIILISVEFKF